MADDVDPQLKALIEHPPAAAADRKSRLAARVRDIAAVVAFIALGLGSYGLYSNSRTAACINTVLNDRNGPNLADQRARDELAAREGAALQLIPSDPSRAINQIQIALRDYQIARAANDASRSSHPLGQC